MNGFTLLVLIAFAAGIPLAYRAGMLRERRDARLRGSAAMARSERDRHAGTPAGDVAAPVGAPATRDSAGQPPRRDAAATTAPAVTAAGALPAVEHGEALVDERARIIRVAFAQGDALRAQRLADAAAIARLTALDDERHRLHRALADAAGEVARYREIVVDIEDDSPPPLLERRNAPDDLKLIVGIGPVLERMLQRLGVASYRQIAHWGEHDIDTFDAKLPEFRGRIRRDGWVTQARSLHQSKYGERP